MKTRASCLSMDLPTQPFPSPAEDMRLIPVTHREQIRSLCLCRALPHLSFSGLPPPNPGQELGLRWGAQHQPWVQSTPRPFLLPRVSLLGAPTLISLRCRQGRVEDLSTRPLLI